MNRDDELSLDDRDASSRIIDGSPLSYRLGGLMDGIECDKSPETRGQKTGTEDPDGPETLPVSSHKYIDELTLTVADAVFPTNPGRASSAFRSS